MRDASRRQAELLLGVRDQSRKFAGGLRERRPEDQRAEEADDRQHGEPFPEMQGRLTAQDAIDALEDVYDSS